MNKRAIKYKCVADYPDGRNVVKSQSTFEKAKAFAKISLKNGAKEVYAEKINIFKYVNNRNDVEDIIIFRYNKNNEFIYRSLI